MFDSFGVVATILLGCISRLSKLLLKLLLLRRSRSFVRSQVSGKMKL